MALFKRRSILTVQLQVHVVWTYWYLRPSVIDIAGEVCVWKGFTYQTSLNATMQQRHIVGSSL